MTQTQVVIDIPASLMTAVPSQETLSNIGAGAMLVVGAGIALLFVIGILAAIANELNGVAANRRKERRESEAKYLAKKQQIEIKQREWETAQAAKAEQDRIAFATSLEQAKQTRLRQEEWEAKRVHR